MKENACTFNECDGSRSVLHHHISKDAPLSVLWKCEHDHLTLEESSGLAKFLTIAKKNHNTAAAILDLTASRLQSAQFDHEEAKALEAEARKVYEYALTLRGVTP